MSQAAWEATLREQADRNGRLFFQLAYGILHDAAAAEDACQQAFLRAWEQRDRIESQDKIQAWLARTVINLSYEVLRRGKTERRALEAYARQSQPAGVLDGPIAPVGTGPDLYDPDEALRRILAAALAGLPKLTRAVVVMRVMRGQSGNEVKDLLGCSAASVSRHMHDGLARLREIMLREERS